LVTVNVFLPARFASRAAVLVAVVIVKMAINLLPS
jgi:hypothetical protein